MQFQLLKQQYQQDYEHKIKCYIQNQVLQGQKREANSKINMESRINTNDDEVINKGNNNKMQYCKWDT